MNSSEVLPGLSVLRKDGGETITLVMEAHTGASMWRNLTADEAVTVYQAIRDAVSPDGEYEE